MTAPYISDYQTLRDFNSFYNRASASSARLIGKGEGLLGRAATALRAKSVGDALSRRRDEWMDEAKAYEEEAGPALTTSEKVAGVVGDIAPTAMAYGAAGSLAGVAGPGLSWGARTLRGAAAAFPVTAAIEGDEQETSTAYTVGKLLGSQRLLDLSESATGRIAVGAAVDLLGNGVAEGIGSGLAKYRAARTLTANQKTIAAAESFIPRSAELPPVTAVPHTEVEPLWKTGVEVNAVVERPAAKLMHHETNIDRGLALLGGVDEDMTGRSLFMATDPAMAVGQGTNKGVRFTLDASGLNHAQHTGKPGLDFAAANGGAEYVARSNRQGAYTDAVRSVEVSPDAFASNKGYARRFRDHLLPSLESQGWTRETLEDGTLKLSRPGFASPALMAHVASTGVGAITGAQIGDTPEARRQNALIGAGVGLGGAAVGTAVLSRVGKAAGTSALGMSDPAVQAIHGMISNEAKGAKKTAVSEFFERLYNQNVNKMGPLNRFSKDVLGTRELEIAAQNGSGWIEAAGSRLKTDYKPVVDAIKGYEPQVTTLAAAERALELGRNGMGNKGFDLAEAQQAVNTLGAIPEVRAGADKLQAYYSSLLDRRLDAGLITPDDYANLRLKGEFYVPFVRDAEEAGLSSVNKGSKGHMQKGSGLRKMTDEQAESKIKNPLESAIEDTYSLEHAIARQRVNDLIVKGAAQNPTVADQFIRPVPKGAKAPAGYVIETIRHQGADKTYMVDRDFHAAWTALAPQGQDIALKVAGAFKSVQRGGVTLAPVFTAKNFIRDAAFTAVQQPFAKQHLGAGVVGAAAGAMSSDDHPVEGAVMGFASGVMALHGAKIVRAMADVVGHSKAYSEFLQAGGGGFGFWPKTQKDLGTTLAKLRDGTTPGDVANPKSWLAGLEYINHMIETAPRLAEAKRLSAAGVGAMEAANAGRNISVDFSKQGSGQLATVMGRTTPFFNAKIQGLAKSLTTLRDPKAWAMGATLITAPSIALWNINKDDPDYWKQPLWIRNTCWLVKQDDGTFTKYPKPHEFGYLFASVPERFLDWAYQNGKLGDVKERVPNDLGQAMAQLGGAVGLDIYNDAPGIVRPLVETAMNKDMFRQKPIVGAAFENLPNELQYDDRSSSIARGIGAVTGASPMKVDHLIQGYTGSTGRILNEKATQGLRATNVDDRGKAVYDKSQGMFGGFFTDPTNTPQPALDILASDREAAGVEGGVEHLIKTGQYDKIGGYFERYGSGMGQGQLTSAVADNLRSLAEAELQIERDRSLDPETKRKQIIAIRDAQYQVAKAAVPQS